jgi:hypothetical protein
MSTADFKAAVALAVEQVLGLVKTDAAPPAPAPAEPAAADIRAKRLAALEKARAAKKAKAEAKPAAKPAKAAKAKPEPVAAVKADAPAWTVKDHITQKGVKGKTINVGPFSAWLADGDDDKRAAIIAAINGVFRHAQCDTLVKAICR